MTRPRPNDPCWCGSGRKYKRCHGPRDRLEGITPSPTSRSPAGLVAPGEVSPPNLVPVAIPRPDYALTGRPRSERPRDVIKGPEQIERMRRACACAREVLDLTLAAVRPGITTDELDRYAHGLVIERGAYPSPLNYHGFPKSICTSVNEVICHGIPDSRPLTEGDIVNVDITVFLDGMHGDCSETTGVGAVDEASTALLRCTQACLAQGIAAVRPGGLVRDIGRAIETQAQAEGFGVVRAFVGHGIGELFHMDPQVPHYFDQSARFELKPGMTFTIEPMINAGTWRHEVWADGWTAVTADRKRSAQYEHTVLVTDTGVEILTARTGSA